MRKAIRLALLRLPFGLRLDFWIRGWRRKMRGYWELELLKFLVDPEKNAVDIGANVGYFTFWLQKYARQVYAYEPNRANLRHLKGATGNVEIRPLALSDGAGTASFRVRKRSEKRWWRRWLGAVQHLDHRGGSLSFHTIGDEFIEYEVPTRSLDAEEVGEVGFIKIDVEGHEMTVLKGARKTIARCKPVLLIEIEERHTNRPVLDILSEIESWGYRTLTVTRNGLVNVTRDPNDPARFRLPSMETANNFIFLPI